jgi:hypothetical protein
VSSGVFAALALIALIGGYIAADYTSGHMPFSGYAEETFWGRVSLGLLIVSVILAGFALFV